jgi:hypothetical protein
VDGQPGPQGQSGQSQRVITVQLLSRVAVAGEVERREVVQGFGESSIGELIADPATFRGRGDETALPETSQMVRQVGTGGAEPIGEFCWIAGSVEEVDEDAPAGRVGESRADAAESAEVEGRTGYSHDSTIQQRLYAQLLAGANQSSA